MFREEDNIFSNPISETKTNFRHDVIDFPACIAIDPRSIMVWKMRCVFYCFMKCSDFSLKYGVVVVVFRRPLVLQSHHTRSNFVVDIKKNVSQASDSVGLSCVKAHAGNPENETSDHFG
ncbi:hypothetical protein AVEN_222375-1 [Araneus ventricosus]|uniref:Uncharacterized protein n=1 Tax=Araneus ventricosus TaxID=182803 RepID=A0A4Y2EGT9_ARAVE|nr:hypothetical protein AVEN_222375-1 [Araneus ventricosus]